MFAPQHVYSWRRHVNAITDGAGPKSGAVTSVGHLVANAFRSAWNGRDHRGRAHEATEKHNERRSPHCWFLRRRRVLRCSFLVDSCDEAPIFGTELNIYIYSGNLGRRIPPPSLGGSSYEHPKSLNFWPFALCTLVAFRGARSGPPALLPLCSWLLLLPFLCLLCLLATASRARCRNLRF